MTETAEITRATKAAVLRALAGAAHPRIDAPTIASNHGLTIEDVKAIANVHGGIDQPARLLKAAQTLERRQTDDVETAETDRVPNPTPLEPDYCNAASPDAPLDHDTTSTVDVIVAARKSPKARTRNLGKRIEDQLTTLREYLDTEQADAKRRAEIEALEAKLRALRSKPAKPKTSKAKPASTADRQRNADIRAWAADNNIACPPRGRIPTKVREAYEAEWRQS